MTRILFRTKVLLVISILASGSLCAQDDPYATPDHQISYLKEVKPILRKKCMACHACYDSPAQLNFTNAFGVERGAAKIDPFAVRMKTDPFFRLAHTDKSIEDFRELGFFSVINGGKDSIMAKMIKLGYDEKNRWKHNEPIPAHIDIDAINHRLTAPNKREIDGYVVGMPKQGMPFATTGLDAKEYTTLMTWLEQGAKFDETPLQATAVENSVIGKWEEFLNRDDNEHKLAGRYMYEHMYGYHMYFDKDSQNFFAMVRSSTPPGQPVKPISTRHGNTPIENDFWYRFAIVDVVLHSKRHVPVDVTGDEWKVYTDLLFEIPFKVDKLPGYTDAERHNALTTFAAIPAKSRYKFLLHQCYYQERVVSTGPSCRGAMNVSMTLECYWYLNENPETSLLCNDQEYYDLVAPKLGSMLAFNSAPQMLATLEQQLTDSRKASELAVARLKEKPRSAITDIWAGDRPNDIPGFTAMRHDDCAYEVPRLAGAFPDRVIVSDLAALERRIYLSTVNYDTFTNAGDLFSIRMDFSNARLRTELNYLRFLPDGKRKEELEKLYKHGMHDPWIQPTLPDDIHFPSLIEYKTDNVREEFMGKVVEYLRGKVQVDDPIYRPGKDAGEASDAIKAMRLISKKAEDLKAAGEDGFRLYLDAASVIRIEKAGQEPDMFTMCVNWGINELSYAGDVINRPPVKLDTIMVLKGVTTPFPNFMFNVKDTEIMDFAKSLSEADSEDKFLAVVDRWGVHRTRADFWELFHSMEEYVRRTDPRSGALLDCSRYIDYWKDNMPKRNWNDPRLQKPNSLAESDTASK